MVSLGVHQLRSCSKAKDDTQEHEDATRQMEGTEEAAAGKPPNEEQQKAEAKEPEGVI